MRHPLKEYTLALTLIFTVGQAVAQATKVVTDPDSDFKLARDLYQKGQTSLAYPLFKTLNYNRSKTQQGETALPLAVQTEVQYYTIVCGLMMDDETAARDAKAFESGGFDQTRTEMVSYYLGEYYFRKQQYADATSYFEKAGNANLTNEQIASLKFHEGYSYFMLKQFSKAKPLFNAIRQIPDDPNYIDANYYYGFIVLDEKNYAEALSSFQKVEKAPRYKNIVPYYIMQIYYFQGNTDKAIAYGENALKTGGDQYYAKNMKQLLGHALFDRQQYAQALPYLEEFVTTNENASREDIYQLSYCYYDAKQWDKAITGFKQLSGTQDSLAQNSMYLLADAYLETGQKANARNAFLICSMNSSNPSQKEISQFNYAKLSYELGYQDVALNELKKFLTAYPSSAYRQQANELLVGALANTNNYSEALDLVQKTGLQSETVQRAYPRILFGRAIEEINDQQLDQASDLLDKLFAARYNEAEKQPAYFWKGEIANRSGQYDASVQALTKYLENPTPLGDANEKNAYYTLGYSYLKSHQYTKALNSFQKVAATVTASSTAVQQDAYLRQADCYFMNKQFSRASQMYNHVIDNNLNNADYAYYQKAVIAGAQGRPDEKVKYLQGFSQRYGNSALSAEANMEMANAYMAQENFEQAIKPLNAIISNPNASGLHPQAFLNVGVCQYNLNNNDAALATFQKLISRYPNSQESTDAIDYVRSIYTSRGQPDGYVSFMRQNGKTVSYAEADSLIYSTAIAAYNNREYTKAVPALENYIRLYPQGKYDIAAHFQLADIANQQRDYAKALSNYNYVASKSPNQYAESAVLEAARISYFQNKDYEKAAQYYLQLKNIATSADNRLESMRGLLRCQYRKEQWTEALPNAQDLLKQSGIAVDDKQMANLIIAKNAQLNDNSTQAITAYRNVYALGKSEYAAEARYRVAEILMSENKLKEAETAAFDVINKAGSYDFWITKSYILLGEIYYREKDYFNAEATLKSVVENASDASLKAEAQKHLDAVIAARNKSGKLK